eukprot:TRINITY_DN20133_c0_g2_i1.p1 TRINITY_DN20133_c0_g2~~TRINITY_DN20133_c0_g2_i1.p1  ORF type:complete len:1070 (+),score=209.28 TRINITY_DN20133_c0_g2_i1:171-3380(+)
MNQIAEKGAAGGPRQRRQRRGGGGKNACGRHFSAPDSGAALIKEHETNRSGRHQRNYDQHGGVLGAGVPPVKHEEAQWNEFQASGAQQNKAINRQVTRAADTGDIADLLRIVEQCLPDMNGINLATSLHRVSKLAAVACHGDGSQGIKQHPVVRDLFAKVVRHVCCHSLLGGVSQVPEREMPAQCMSIVAWSCATLRIRNDRLMEAIGTISTPRLHELKPFELSNLLWAYAKMSSCPSGLFKAVVARLLDRRRGEFKVQCLSTAAWAFATLQKRSSQLFTSIALELVSRACEMKSQEISNTLWAFAKVHAGGKRFPHAALFGELSAAAREGSFLWQFKVQELSNTVWAFATVGMDDPQLFAAVAEVAVARRQELAMQHVANILWAFARLKANEASVRLVPALLEVALENLSSTKPQELTALVWAASQLCPERIEFFSVSSQECIRRLADFSSNALGNLAAIFADPKVGMQQVVEPILRESLGRMQQLEPVAMCRLLGAVSLAGDRVSVGVVKQLGDGVADVLERRLAMKDVAAVLRAGGIAAGAEALSHALDWESWPRGDRDSASVGDILQEDTAGTLNAARNFGNSGVSCMSTSAESHSSGEDAESCFTKSRKSDDCSYAAFVRVPGVQNRRLSSSDESIRSHETAVAMQKSPPANVVATASGPGSDAFMRVPLPSNFATASPLANTPSSFDASATPAFAPSLNWFNGEKLPGSPMEPSASLPVHVRLPEPWHAPATVVPPLCPSDAVPQVEQMAMAFQAPVALGSNSLRVVDGSCLAVVSVDGSLQPFDLSSWAMGTMAHISPLPVLRLRQGLLDVRVVLRRVPLEACPAVFPTFTNTADLRHVLRPVARVLDVSACIGGFAILAYPHCSHGTLKDWMLARSCAGESVSAAEAARIVHGVFVGATALLEHGANALSAVQASEVFVDEGGVALVREPLRGLVGDWNDSVRWLSPEEAIGRIDVASTGVDTVWPSLAHRLGLMLYCLRSSDGAIMDPYPAQSSNEVLLGLLREVREGPLPSLRPDLGTWEGPTILRHFLGACLRIGGQPAPALAIVPSVLDAVAASDGY